MAIEKYDEGTRWAVMYDVIELYAQNYKIGEIAKKLNITNTEVHEYMGEWRESTKGQRFLQERVDDLVGLLDQHFSSLIREGNKTLSDINNYIEDNGVTPPILAQRTAAIKLIADIEAKRVETMQKAGLLRDDQIADEMAAQQEEMDMLVDILKSVTSKCSNCGPQVAIKLAQIREEAMAYDIEGEVV